MINDIEKFSSILESVPIYGFQGTTVIDYPNHIASIIFTGHCNLRCPYCHNKDLVDVPDTLQRISPDYLLAQLKKRKKFNNGVTITGGEPLLFDGIYELVRFLKEDLGYSVKLDTNGTNFELLNKIVESGFVDYIAMDVKAIFEKYFLLGLKSESDLDNIKKSIEYLKKTKNIDSEFRITLHPEILSMEDLDKYIEILQGDVPLYIQLFRPGTTLDPEWTQKDAVTPKIAKKYRDKLAKKLSVFIRN